ncbi:MAG: prepilin-type N-terminal cleavage/methylation domain-containing protein [Woeseia sp.]
MKRKQQAFTLVELVVTIAISGIVVSFMAMFIAGPVAGFADQTRRAELVDMSENALRRIARDIRRALPNSVRVTSNGAVVAIEMLNSVDGVRYREQPPGDADSQLDFASADNAFNSVGQFTQISRPFSSTSHYLSIYNVGVPGADAYELANVITPPGTQIDIDADAMPGEDSVRLSPAFRFAYGSPGQRLFLLDGPVSYLCDTATGTLRRYTGYAIANSQSDRDSDAELLAAGAARVLVTDRVADCNIAYAPGTAQRAGLVTLAMSVADTNERVALLYQVHVDNVP